MDSQLRSYYLQAMGVTEWQLRPAKEPDSPALSVSGFVAAAKGRLLLLAQGSSDPERQLFVAIAKAVGLLSVKDCADLSVVLNHLAAYSTVIVLGSAPVSSEPGVITTHSLATLLKEPQLKRETWKILQSTLTRS